MPQLIVLPPTAPALLRRRIVITGIFFLLANLYAAVTPIFEVSDEVSHYPVVDYIADHAALPVQDVNRTREYDWEAAQPPLYYAIAALLVSPFNRDDMESHLVDNPHAKVGIGLATDNHNFVLHDLEAESFPWRGTPLHVHLLRIFSVFLGTGAVWMTFTVARLTMPERPAAALVALCLSAFNPMFLAVVGSVNNDNLVIFLVPIALAVMLTLWREGFTWARVIALGLLGTLAAASKVSGALIFLPAGLTIFLVVWRDKRPWLHIVYSALIFVTIWAVLFGWWYVRNWDLYDDPLGNTHMAETVGLRENPITIPELFRDESFSFYAAYWGWFGAVNILAPMSLFYYTAALLILASFGLLRVVMRDSTKKLWEIVPIGLLVLTILGATVSLIQWTLLTPASQGRLLFPFMAAIHTLAGIGLVEILRSKRAVLVASPLAAFAAFCILVTIPHAFRLPAEFDSLPSEASPVDVTYGQIQLLGYEVSDDIVEPGGLLEVTLYWRAQERTAQPLSFYIQAYGPGSAWDETVEVGKLDSYPGRGLLQTDSWETDAIYQDIYFLEIDDSASEPFQPRLKVGWRDQTTEQEIPASVDSVILRGGRVTQDREASGDLAEFGGMIRLRDVETEITETQIILRPTWEATDSISEDFTVFVQLIDPARPTEPLAFGDSMPRGDWWPTSSWVDGHPFEDRYTIALTPEIPPGDYQILFGFYRPSDFMRLSADDSPYPDAYSVEVTLPGE